jgi:hypothetical protein
MQSAELSDDELWHAIAKNTEDMSALLLQEADFDNGDCIASHVLASKFHCEYREYVAELQRRHPCFEVKNAGDRATCDHQE